MLGTMHFFDSFDGLSRIVFRVHNSRVHVLDLLILGELIITELEEDIDPLIDLLQHGVKVGLS